MPVKRGRYTQPDAPQETPYHLLEIKLVEMVRMDTVDFMSEVLTAIYTLPVDDGADLQQEMVDILVKWYVGLCKRLFHVHAPSAHCTCRRQRAIVLC